MIIQRDDFSPPKGSVVLIYHINLECDKELRIKFCYLIFFYKLQT